MNKAQIITLAIILILTVVTIVITGIWQAVFAFALFGGKAIVLLGDEEQTTVK